MTLPQNQMKGESKIGQQLETLVGSSVFFKREEAKLPLRVERARREWTVKEKGKGREGPRA